MNRVMNTQDKSSELRQRLIRDDMSGGELLVIDRQRGVHLLYYVRGCKQQV
jgi:hypothetical protein